jgi:regulator of sigma E protease
MLVEPRFPCVIDSLAKDMPAERVGLKKGDRVIAVNGNSTLFYDDVTENLKKNKYTVANLGIVRGNDTMQVRTPVTGDGTIGFVPKLPSAYFDIDTINYGFFAAFPAGIRKAYDTFDGYVKQMKVIFTVKDAHREIGGFMSIGKAYSTTWDWQRFWTFTAFLSIVLAIMNILPIPALDGGHVMFLLYEVITRRKPNEKLMEYAQYAGMFLLLALLLYANGNDVVRLFK